MAHSRDYQENGRLVSESEGHAYIKAAVCKMWPATSVIYEEAQDQQHCIINAGKQYTSVLG